MTLNVLKSQAHFNQALNLSRMTARPSLVLGKPGISKSAYIRQYLNQHGYFAKTLLGSQLSIVLVEGMPEPSKNRSHTEWLPDRFVAELHHQHRKGKPVALLVDEIQSIQPEFLSFLYAVFHDRKFGRHALPPNTLILGAGNDEDSGNAAFCIDSVLTNRTRVYQFEGPTLAEWLSFMGSPANTDTTNPATGRQNRPCHRWLKIALETGKAALYAYDADMLVNTTLRSNQAASEDLHLIESHGAELGIGAADIARHLSSGIRESDAVAVEHVAAMEADLPSWDAIRANPKTARVPDDYNVAALLLVSSMIAERVDHTQQPELTAAINYLYRLPRSAWSRAIQPLVLKCPKLAATSAVKAMMNELDGLAADLAY